MPIVESIIKIGERVDPKGNRGIFRVVLSDKDYPRDQLRGLIIIGKNGEVFCPIMPGDIMWYKEKQAFWTSKPYMDGISNKNPGQDICWDKQGKDFDIIVGEFYRKG